MESVRSHGLHRVKFVSKKLLLPHDHYVFEITSIILHPIFSQNIHTAHLRIHID